MERIFDRLKKFHGAALARLRGGTLSPARLAGSIALGLFIGILPLYGAHLPLCAFFGLLFRLDVLITYAAANISIPPMIPVLLYASAQLGAVALTGSTRALGTEIHSVSLLALTTEVLLGSVLLATFAALVGGGLAYAVASSVKKKRRSRALGPLDNAVAGTCAHYANVAPYHRHYVSSKLRLDPLTKELFLAAQTEKKRASSDDRVMGELLDVGAGRGQFSLLLAELGVVSAIEGFDHDPSKVQVATRAALGVPIPTSFGVGDLRTRFLPSSDTILLLDVLHYLDVSEQNAALTKVASALRPGGRLYLRENNRGGGWGAVFAAHLETWGRLCGINRGGTLAFRSPAEYEQVLMALGLHVEKAPGRGPLDNVLLVARRPNFSS